VTPPESDLTLREVWRGQQRIEATQQDILRRLDRMHEDFVSQRQFDAHVQEANAKFADLKALISAGKVKWTEVVGSVLLATSVTLTVLLLIFQRQSGG
jgi:hypothetical protein